MSTNENRTKEHHEETGHRFKFPKSRRVRSSLDFQRVYERKQRAGDEHLLIFADANHLATTRIGLSVSRKNGNSIVRHRIRRLLKEAYRLEQHEIPEGLDLILIPRPGSQSTVDEYRESLVKLACKLERRIKANQSGEAK